MTAPFGGYFLAASGVDSTSFTLNWSSSVDNVTPQESLQYLVCSGSSLLAVLTVEDCLSGTIEQDWTPNVSSLFVTGKTYASVYHFNVLVKDVAGNISPYDGKTQGTSGVFMSRWNTGNVGVSGSGQIKLPLENGGNYNFVVDWGDGSIETITAWDSPAVTHTYPMSAGWVIGISGTLEGFRFNNQGDQQKLLEIQQWGTLRLGNSGAYFYGANNLNISATDNLDLTGTTDLSFAFADCSSLTTIPNLENWDISNVINMTDMLSGVTLSTENYESVLISWSALTVQPNIVFDAGNSIYNSEAATVARNILTESPNNWTIHDGVLAEK